MHAVTHIAEFNLPHIDEGSDLARTLERLRCQMNHPCMQGRMLDLSALLSKELRVLDGLPRTAGQTLSGPSFNDLCNGKLQDAGGALSF